MSKKTITAYRSRLDFFLEYCGTTPTYMDEIDEGLHQVPAGR